MSTNRFALAAVATVSIVTLAACSSASSSSPAASGSASGGSKTITIGVSVADQKSLSYIAAVDGMKKAAADAGVTLNILSADNDANKQVNQVNDLLTQNVSPPMRPDGSSAPKAAATRASACSRSRGHGGRRSRHHHR